jgi:transcriptional regulator with XRE-family HTH domain
MFVTVNVMKSLKVVRIIGGYTQWDLSKKTGIPNYKISLFENGRISPSHQELGQLSQALGTTVEVLEQMEIKIEDGFVPER